VIVAAVRDYITGSHSLMRTEAFVVASVHSCNKVFFPRVLYMRVFTLWCRPTTWTQDSANDASADYTALSADYIWPSGFLCGRPDGLELTTDWVSWSVFQFWWL